MSPAMRSQLASPDQLRSRFPPVAEEEYKDDPVSEEECKDDPTMSDSPPAEYDDVGELIYDEDGSMLMLVYDTFGNPYYQKLGSLE
jgi:hypothetical protein